MVEVFKTNVKDRGHANMLIDQIHNTFTQYRANFDLEDADNILRVECATASIPSAGLIGVLKTHGFHAEVLPDDDYSIDQMALIKTAIL